MNDNKKIEKPVIVKKDSQSGAFKPARHDNACPTQKGIRPTKPPTLRKGR